MTTSIISVSETESKIQVNGLDALTLNSSGNIGIKGINGGQIAGVRNRIINGGMEIAQRGTSFPAIAPNAYSLDRWSSPSNAGVAVITASQPSDAPPNNEFQYSLRHTVTTADASIAAGDFSGIRQRIEGYNVRDLIGRTFTLSFWVRSSKTGTHCVTFVNAAGDRSYVSEYAVSAANTWEQKSITVSGGLITAGTWDWSNGIGLAVHWSLAAGSTYQNTANAWQTGNFFATANQVNCLDTVGNIFAITGVQLEVGSVATPFEHRPYGMELALCQRYYEVGGSSKIRVVDNNNTTVAIVPFKVTKRAAPIMAGTGLGTTSDVDIQSFSKYLTGAGTVDTGYFIFTATAEL